MKKSISIAMILSAVLSVSCQKENILTEVPATETSENNEPLHFKSLSDIKNALYSMQNADAAGIETKSAFSEPGFISYAETVMQTPEYEDKPNAIISEVFGSILNPDGEVVFGNYMLKVCDYGILYSDVANINTVRSLVSMDFDMSGAKPAASCPIPLNDPEKIYVLDGYEDIYLYDTFGIFAEAKTKATEQEIFGSKTWHMDGTRFDMGLNWSRDYTYPEGAAQKTTFSSDSKKANDTKIYKRDAGIYAESGVKVKTMKKGFLGTWSKFTAPVKAAIEDLVILEEDWSFGSAPAGWVDVNQVDYAGKTYTVATKKLSGLFTGISESALINDCNQAVTWAQSRGLSVSYVDGVRYVNPGAQTEAFVRLRNNVKEANADKLTAFFNLEYGGRYGTSGSASGNSATNVRGQAGYYKVFTVTMYGTSTYNGEEKGARMIYTFLPVD